MIVIARTVHCVAHCGDDRGEAIGRGERIRTSDSCVPNAVLYQAELRPDRGDNCASNS